MAAAAAGHPGSLHHALQSPPNSNAAAINPAGGFLFLPQNPNAGMQGQQMHPGTNKNNVILIKEFIEFSFHPLSKRYIKLISAYFFRKRSLS